MFEQPLIIAPKPEAALDDQWYARYSKLAAFQSYEYLSGEKEYVLDNEEAPSSGPLEKQRRALAEGSLNLPELSYPKLKSAEGEASSEIPQDKKYSLDDDLVLSKLRLPKIKEFDARKIESDLFALKEEIEHEEKNEVVKKAYLWKINEKIAEARMLQAAKDGDDVRFARYSRFIFGSPDKTVFDYTLFELSKKIGRALHSDNLLIRTIAERLQKELLDGKKLEHTEELRNTDASSHLDWVPSKTNPHVFPKELAKTPEKELDEKELDAREIAAAFQQALEEEYQLRGWKVVVSDTATAINISQAKKAVTVPEKRRLKRKALVGLIKHEIGVHVRRRERGERSQLKLLGLGLDRYGDDEGVAVYEEQKVTGAEDFAGFGGYLAISLALGADGKKRNFREVYDLLEDYFIMNGSQPAAAQKSAWGLAFRTFRGTSGKTPGACFTKDLLYRKGNIGVWNIVREKAAHEKPSLADGDVSENEDFLSEERRFMVGKYDPNNPRHILILDQLGITERDLATLET